ncbi:MAG: hypothetical protein ISN26_05770 [Betaproteobacteria bacterium AqS2]|uniref:Uncharacterized protein n=1 Tax=Candidatus Amphirhobacter heronislandensis TaxID=1732024 RepID=A0A930UFQ1_9GAMM|nr:hypothetical protein [Betaproteobacteria bacterium AqS2]
MLAVPPRLLRLLNGVRRLCFGTTPRMLATLAALGILAGWLALREPEAAGADADAELARALELARDYEAANSELRRELEAERRLRRVANQTTAALAAQIRALDEQILDNEQRIAFYRQLLAERGSDVSAVAIRSFEIVPDYREDHHQLVVVLSQPADNENFVGSLDLVLSLRSAERGEFELRPAFAAGLLQVNFRYYIEFKEIFQLPPGAEIVNGQLVLRDAANEVVTSQILREQAF